jgi:hypothetical protein
MAKSTPTAAPTNVRTIMVGTKDKKLEFDNIPQPYVEGHAISAIEAKVLNQVFAENIGNNVRAKVQAHLKGEEDALDEAALREFVAEKASSYEFSEAAAGGSTASLSPVEKEARKLARALVTDHLREQGRKVKDVDKQAFEDAIVETAADPEVIALAEERVAQLSKVGNIKIGGIAAASSDGEDAGDEAEAA